MSDKEFQATIARMQAENDALTAKLAAAKSPGVTFRVSYAGAVSAYGLGQFPVTLFRSQWKRILDKAAELTKVIDDNAAMLTDKDDSEETKAAKLALRVKAGVKPPMKRVA